MNIIFRIEGDFRHNNNNIYLSINEFNEKYVQILYHLVTN